MAKYKKKAKGYGLSKVIKHPQGTYRVRFLSKKRTLGNSKLLWFKNKKGEYIKV